MSMEPTGRATAAPRDPAARAARLLEQLRHSRTLWSLRNADGWVMMEERGTPGLPVWPSDAEAPRRSARARPSLPNSRRAS